VKKIPKTKFFIFFVLSLCITCVLPVFALEQNSSKHILDNGLTVLVREMPQNSMVSVYALVNTGSATEGEFLGTGISHFLEHMLFKGTEKRDTRQIPAEIQAVGGSINASTSHDFTIYTLTVPFESFDTALEVLSDMLMNSKMDPQEIEKERQVIFKEMKLHNDNPDRRLSRLAFESVYIKHPYRHPVIGYKSLLAEISDEDLVEYYRLHYAPNNIILSIAGNVKTDEVVSKVKAAFRNFQRKRYVPRDVLPEPQQISFRRYEEEYPNTDLTRLSLSFSGVSLLDQDLYALDVLAQILGEGGSSRFFLDLYKKQGLVYSISASNFTPVDRGIFEIEALLDEDNVERVIKELLAHIAKVKKRGVTKKELDKAKQQVLSDYIFGNQTVSRVAWIQALDEAFTGDQGFSLKYVENIRKVENEDIVRVAGTYLGEDVLTIVVLKPQGKPADENLESKEIIEVSPIVKHQLDNGLTVLLREDHTFPLVSIRLSLNGGLRQEPSDLNGVSALTASLWVKGTKSRTAEEIAKLSDSLGMRLGGSSGKNSFGLNMDFLSGDVKVALELLEDFIYNPAFFQKEMDKVKENMKTSLRRRNENIGRSTGYAMKQLLFLKHPYRLDENGTEASIERITRDDVVEFYDRLVVPGNMVLSVFGDIDKEKMMDVIRKKFVRLKERKVALNRYVENPPEEPRENEIFLDKEQAMVMFGFQGAPMSSRDRYPLEVLTAILGSSFSGRMFNNIREELGDAYTLGGNYIPGIDAGIIYFYALTTEDKVVKVKELVENEIKKIQAEYVSDKELENIKMYLKGSFKSRLQTNAAVNATASLDELYGLGFDHYKQYDALIDNVTKEDIKRSAGKYLDLQKKVVILTRPDKEN